MKKILKKIIKGEVQFAIRKMTKGETVHLLPMVKSQGWFEGWVPIVKIYDSYIAMPYEKEGGLTEEECKAHIEGYNAQLSAMRKHNVFSIEYLIQK